MQNIIYTHHFGQVPQIHKTLTNGPVCLVQILNAKISNTYPILKKIWWLLYFRLYFGFVIQNVCSNFNSRILYRLQYFIRYPKWSDLNWLFLVSKIFAILRLFMTFLYQGKYIKPFNIIILVYPCSINHVNITIFKTK